MLIQCSKCGARGNVRSEDPGKVFRCPKCGGGMRAAQAGAASPQAVGRAAQRPRTSRQRPVTSRAGTSRTRTSRIAERRRSRKKTPVLAITLGLLAVAAACGGGYYYYKLINEPGPGAQALGLLPNTAVFAAFVEDLPALARDLAQLSDAEPHKISGAVEAYRKRFETDLMQALKIDYAAAARLLSATRAAGVGSVPAAGQGGAMATVSLLALDEPIVATQLLQKIPPAADITGVRLHKGNAFCVMLDDVLAICEERGPLEAMARSFQITGTLRSTT